MGQTTPYDTVTLTLGLWFPKLLLPNFSDIESSACRSLETKMVFLGLKTLRLLTTTTCLPLAGMITPYLYLKSRKPLKSAGSQLLKLGACDWGDSIGPPSILVTKRGSVGWGAWWKEFCSHGLETFMILTTITVSINGETEYGLDHAEINRKTSLLGGR
jgi:hypothetical protein